MICHGCGIETKIVHIDYSKTDGALHYYCVDCNAKPEPEPEPEKKGTQQQGSGAHYTSPINGIFTW